MSKIEISIEDFISKEELSKMTDKELEIYKKVFLLNKQRLHGLTDELENINGLNKKLDDILGQS